MVGGKLSKAMHKILLAFGMTDQSGMNAELMRMDPRDPRVPSSFKFAYELKERDVVVFDGERVQLTNVYDLSIFESSSDQVDVFFSCSKGYGMRTLGHNQMVMVV